MHGFIDKNASKSEPLCGKSDIELALNIMHLRALGHEPHNFFHNGGQLFEDMAAAWGFEEGG